MSCEFGRIPVYGEFRFSYSGHGRPRKHGDSFQLTNLENWTPPNSSLELDTSKSGRVRVRMWKDLHFSKAADCAVNLILVERLEPTGSGRIMPPLWLVWTGERTMPLEEIWDQYLGVNAEKGKYSTFSK